MSRNAVAIVSSVLFVALAALLVLLPVPYVAWRPGQTIDVLAANDGKPIIEVAGTPTFGTTGKQAIAIYHNGLPSDHLLVRFDTGLTA